MPSDRTVVTVAMQSARGRLRDPLDVLAEEFRELRPGVSSPAGSLPELYAAIHGLAQPRSAL